MNERIALTLLLGLIPLIVGPLLAILGYESLSSWQPVLVAVVLGASLATVFTRKVHPKGSICAQALKTHLAECVGLYLWLILGGLALAPGASEFSIGPILLASVVSIPAICVNAWWLANLRSS